MEKVAEVTCYIRWNGSDYVMLPITRLDKTVLDTFLDDRGRKVVVRLMNKQQSKSYDQTKAFWALMNMSFQCINGYKPNTIELKQYYYDTLSDFFPTRESLDGKGELVPKHWSELTKEEGIEVISRVIMELSEMMDIPPDIQANCKDIFDWVTEQKKIMAQKNEEPEESALLKLANEALADD